eukprot:scpid77682/ scgid20738/ 
MTAAPSLLGISRARFFGGGLATISMLSCLWLLLLQLYLADVFHHCADSMDMLSLHSERQFEHGRLRAPQPAPNSAPDGGESGRGFCDKTGVVRGAVRPPPGTASPTLEKEAFERKLAQHRNGGPVYGAAARQSGRLQAADTRYGSEIIHMHANRTKSEAPSSEENIVVASGLLPFDCATPTSWTQQCHTGCERGCGRIPRLVHFVQIGDKLGFTQWLSVMSAVRFLRPQLIILHHTGNLTTCWARRIRSHPLVQFNKARRSDFPSRLNNMPVTFLAHLADFMRASALWQYGGIYMDSDMIITKSFDDLMVNEAVFAEEIGGNICNALMLSRKASCCICQFSKKMCRDFDGSWSHHSVLALTALLKKGRARDRYSSDAVRILPHETGFFPYSWEPGDMALLFKRNATASQFTPGKVYALHLYNHVLKDSGFADATTFSAIAAGHTPYALSSRNVIPSSFTLRHMDEKQCLPVPRL